MGTLMWSVMNLYNIVRATHICICISPIRSDISLLGLIQCSLYVCFTQKIQRLENINESMLLLLKKQNMEDDDLFFGVIEVSIVWKKCAIHINTRQLESQCFQCTSQTGIC